MGLLDFLNDENIDWAKDDSYIGNLISLFISYPAVTAAYFGLLYGDTDMEGDLFLAVAHAGDTEELHLMTEKLRQTFFPEKKIYFTSDSFQPELMGYIVEGNFPFYVKNRPQALSVTIMKQWFNPEKYITDLIRQIKTGKVISLFKDFDPFSSNLNFQTFVRNGREFIPLFSDKDMVFKSGMTEVPEDLTVMEFDWRKVNNVVDGNFKEHFYVLNPGTSFEVEFVT